MEDFYPQIRATHIGSVIASGSLFALRGAALNLFGATWPRALPAKTFPLATCLSSTKGKRTWNFASWPSCPCR